MKSNFDLFSNEYPHQYNDFKNISNHPDVKESMAYLSELRFGFVCVFIFKNGMRLEIVVNYREIDLKMTFDKEYLVMKSKLK